MHAEMKIGLHWSVIQKWQYNSYEEIDFFSFFFLFFALLEEPVLLLKITGGALKIKQLMTHTVCIQCYCNEILNLLLNLVE